MHKERGLQYQKEEIQRVRQFSVLNEVISHNSNLLNY